MSSSISVLVDRTRKMNVQSRFVDYVVITQPLKLLVVHSNQRESFAVKMSEIRLLIN